MTIKPQNFEEKLVWYTIIGTYGLYFLGAGLLWVPALAWFLMLYLCKKLWNQTEDTPIEDKITIPASTWIWIVSMLLMEVCVIMSHIDLDLGMARIIKTSIAWARSWALMALFPLIGCLKIRPQILYRAVCILCLQSLVFSLVCYLGYRLNLPDISYVSPVGRISPKIGTEYVYLFTIGDGNEFRLNLFTKFANSLGIVGSIYFFLASQESDKKLRWIAMISAVIMVVGSVSRLTTFGLVIVPILTWSLTNFSWPLQTAAGVVSCLAGMFAPLFINFIENTWNKGVKGYRSGSERVRSKLIELALERWSEAPLWGHGFVAERGPKSTEYIPIGTHAQWPDLLYVKGLVGFTAFLIPLLWSFMDLLIKAQKSRTAKVGLSIILLLLLVTYAGDVEAEAYNYWPGLVILGIAFKEKAPAVVTTNKKYTFL